MIRSAILILQLICLPITIGEEHHQQKRQVTCSNGAVAYMRCSIFGTCSQPSTQCINSACCPVCPNGAASLGLCPNGTCTPNTNRCISGLCCPKNGGTCPDGQPSDGPCINGFCSGGYGSCQSGQCCPPLTGCPVNEPAGCGVVPFLVGYY